MKTSEKPVEHLPTPEILLKSTLETLFGSEEALGVYYADPCDPDNPDPDSHIALLPGAGQMGTCTRCAAFVVQRLTDLGLPPESLQIQGFWTAENPMATHPALRNDDGHDFAVVGNRFIVDPWISVYTGYETQTVYDLKDPLDTPKIREIYGDPACWTPTDPRRIFLLLEEHKKWNPNENPHKDLEPE